MPLTEADYKGLLIKTLENAGEIVGGDMPISSLVILLKIPTKGEIPMSQLVRTVKMSPAGITRTVGAFAGFSKANRRELDKPMLVLRDDELDRRYKVISMSEAGRSFITRLVAPLVDLMENRRQVTLQ